MMALVFADSLTPRISSRAHMMMRITAGRLNTPPCSGALDNALGIWTPNTLFEELVEVLRPPHGHGGAGDAPLQQQAGADADRRQLTERGVGVGVRRAGHRDRPGQLRVAHRGQAGDDSGDHERPDHGGPGHRHRLAQDEEDPGADRAADTDRREAPQSDRALEFAFSGVCAGFVLHLQHRLTSQHLFFQRCHCSLPFLEGVRCRWP